MEKIRTAQEIVDDANELARIFYESMGYGVPHGYRFDTATHPQERAVWLTAVMAYEFIEGTDVEDAVNEIDDE